MTPASNCEIGRYLLRHQALIFRHYQQERRQLFADV
jgi:hypothetical protein